MAKGVEILPIKKATSTLITGYAVISWSGDKVKGRIEKPKKFMIAAYDGSTKAAYKAAKRYASGMKEVIRMWY